MLHCPHEHIFTNDKKYLSIDENRRFVANFPVGIHQGIRCVEHGVLKSFNDTYIPFLSSISSLVNQLISFISIQFPIFHQFMIDHRPTWYGIGNSYFQTMAVNLNTCSTLHRDPADRQIAWIYYFGDFSGTLDVPELGISLSLKPGCVVGIRSKYLYHGGCVFSGIKHCFVFYGRFHDKSNTPIACDDTTDFILNKLHWV